MKNTQPIITDNMKHDRVFNISIKKKSKASTVSWIFDDQESLTKSTRMIFTTRTIQEYDEIMDHVARRVWKSLQRTKTTQPGK